MGLKRDLKKGLHVSLKKDRDATAALGGTRFRSIDLHYVAGEGPGRSWGPAIYYRTARPVIRIWDGERERTVRRYISVNYIDRRPTTAPQARAQPGSPLGFLRGVGERACLFICSTAIRRAIAAVYRIAACARRSVTLFLPSAAGRRRERLRLSVPRSGSSAFAFYPR